MTATSAPVRFCPDGPAEVDSFLRLTGRTYIYCHTYGDSAPIMSVDDAPAKVSMTVPDPARVTEDDVATAQRLAKAVAEYLAELEHMAADSADGPADNRRRDVTDDVGGAAGVGTSGRPWVLSHGEKEVTSVCARS